MRNQIMSAATLRGLGALLVAGVIAVPAHAASVSVESLSYAWSDDVYNPVSDSYSGPSPGSVYANAINNYGSYAHGSSAATAGSGSVATVATAAITGPDYTDQLEAVSESSAKMTIDDLVFSGPGSTVTTTLNLDWSGSMMETLVPQNLETYGVTNNYLSISGRLFSGATTYLTFSGNRTVSIDQENSSVLQNETISTTGILNGEWPPNGSDLVTGSFTVPTGTAISLELSLFTRSTVGLYLIDTGHIEGTAYTAADFGHTLSLNTDGDVFNLGTGESVDSISGDIAGNTWNGTPVSATAVPLPASVYLFAAGLLVLVGYIRRQTNRSCSNALFREPMPTGKQVE